MASWADSPWVLWGNVDEMLTGGQDPSNPLEGACRELGKPVVSHRDVEASPRGLVMGRRVEDVGESEGRCVMPRIGVEPSGDIILPERGQTSDGSESTSTLRFLSRRCER